MKRRRTGVYTTVSTVGAERCRAFIPDPLPPRPPLQLDDELNDIMDHALLALGRLDTMFSVMPDTDLFLYMYVRKEAVLSSQIEGTQSSLADLLKYESGESSGVPMDDVQEVSNYVAAMNHGLRRMQDGFPLCNRLIREMHKILLRSGRGKDKDPGKFRSSQNWIGGTRPGNAAHVPPPPAEVHRCMGDLELFLHNKPEKMRLLIKAALAHVQFETIHPFLDGNGRLGRLLITLLLCVEQALREPTLYLSLYFKTHRAEYYELLQRVQKDGDWEAWLHFFMTGVRETATQAAAIVSHLHDLFERNEKEIKKIGGYASSTLAVHHALKKRPILSIPQLKEITNLSYPTVKSSINYMESLRIVSEITGRERGKLYQYNEYLKVLNEGTEPL